MTPTSVNVAGGTASIRVDGGVDFASATSLSLNGVFTSEYDNYMIVVRHIGSGNNGIRGRMRLAGADASGANYARQWLLVSSTSITAARETSQSEFRSGSTSANRGGDALYVYGPALAQPTAFRAVSSYSIDGAGIFDTASTHSLSTAYDGVTLLMTAGNFTGMVTVYGYTQ